MTDVNPIVAKCQPDWTRCSLYQKDKNDALTSPPTNYVPKHDGYTMLATNIPLFKEINALPLILDPGRLDESGGIEATLRRNEAKYHMSCRLLFYNTKLDGAQKRQSDSLSSET